MVATPAASALVSTNSICQGQQVQFLWSLIFGVGRRISFAHTSFKWSNLASHNAGVTVAVVGISSKTGPASLFVTGEDGMSVRRDVDHINAYLIPNCDVIVSKATLSLTGLPSMDFGNKADDGGHLTLTTNDVEELSLSRTEEPISSTFLGFGGTYQKVATASGLKILRKKKRQVSLLSL